MINHAKQRLLAGQQALGIVAGLGSTLATAILTNAGYDFILVDNQHGDWDDTSSLAAFRSISLGHAVPMTRVRIGDYTSIGRLLDRGALGVVVPMINTPADARAAVYATRYPPAGGRSWAPPLSAHYGSDYDTWANQEILLTVQIETAQGVENAEEILGVAGVDGCWIGPFDLARSLGVDLNSSEGVRQHEEAILRVLDACKKTGKIPGIYAGNLKDARRWLEHGFLFVTTGSDSGLLSAGAQQALHELRH